MNMGIVTSFVIGGLLLISMLTLNSRVVTDSTRTTVDLVNKTQLDGIRQLAEYDLSHVGFGDDAEIKSFSNDAIRFEADYEGSSEIIEWRFDDSNEITSSTNPNDYVLIREVDGIEQEFRAIEFSMTALDKNGNDVGSCSTVSACKGKNIKSFKIKIIYESAEPVGKNANGTDIFPRSVWTKNIRPGSLNFNG